MGTRLVLSLLEVAVWVDGLHGGFAQREGLRSKVHDRVAIVGNSWATGVAKETTA